MVAVLRNDSYVASGFVLRSAAPLALSSRHPSRSGTTSTTTARYMFDFLKNKKDQEESSIAAAADVEEEEEVERSGNNNELSDEDPIEKIFGFFFGDKEDEPMGMKRFGAARFPEQYPAVIDAWAAPLPELDKTAEMKLLRPLLKNTNLETRGLCLSYDAQQHGWNAQSFHARCDKKGPGIVYCKTTDQLICGGYNPKGWVGYGEARGSIAAFLYVYTQGPQELPTKLRKVGGKSFAANDLPEYGPCFGADSFIIPLDGKRRVARSKLGSYYERFPQSGTETLFGRSRGAQVDLAELKVYHGVWASDEYIPHTDAEPFALY